jgi:hypothetical protein
LQNFDQHKLKNCVSKTNENVVIQTIITIVSFIGHIERISQYLLQKSYFLLNGQTIGTTQAKNECKFRIAADDNNKEKQ